MRGPSPKPSRLKELAGNPGKRPLHPDLLVPAGAPDCPDHLSEEGKSEWARVTNELEQIGILSSVDRAALTLYCQAWDRWRKAEEALEKDGLVITAPSGYPVQNPHIAIANKSLVVMKGLLCEFGLTPSSRTRLHVPEREEADDAMAQLAAEIGYK